MFEIIVVYLLCAVKQSGLLPVCVRRIKCLCMSGQRQGEALPWRSSNGYLRRGNETETALTSFSPAPLCSPYFSCCLFPPLCSPPMVIR